MRCTVGLALAMLAGAAGNAVAQPAIYGLSYHSTPTQISGDGRYVIGEYRASAGGLEHSARWDVLSSTLPPVLVAAPSGTLNSTGVALSFDGDIALSRASVGVTFVTDLSTSAVSSDTSGLWPVDISGAGDKVLVTALVDVGGGAFDPRAEVRNAQTFVGGPIALRRLDAVRMSADAIVIGVNDSLGDPLDPGLAMRSRALSLDFLCSLAGLNCSGVGYGSGDYRGPFLRGVSANGDVFVGDIEVGDGYGGFVSTQPFRYNESASEFTIIGDCLFGGGGDAVDASADGSRVVGMYFCNDSGGPFLYDAPSGEFRYIADILFDAGVDLSRWLLGRAVAISDDGQWITGQGSFIDSLNPFVIVERGWVAFIPTGGACDPLDFNGDGIFPDNQDYADLLTVFAGGTCSNDPNCGDLDFNNDGIFPDNKDIGDFLSYYAGGPCPT
jgi:hypothetical protein